MQHTEDVLHNTRAEIEYDIVDVTCFVMLQPILYKCFNILLEFIWLHVYI